MAEWLTRRKASVAEWLSGWCGVAVVFVVVTVVVLAALGAVIIVISLSGLVAEWLAVT